MMQDHGRTLARTTLAIFAWLAPGLCLAQEAELPALEILPPAIGDNIKVEFESSVAVEAPHRSTKDMRCVKTPSFQVCLDLAGIAVNKFSSGLTYLFYLEPRPSPPPCPPAEVLVVMNPIGSFDDQEQDVGLQVSRAGTTEEAVLRIPLFNLSGGDYLDAFVDEKPETLQIGSEGKIWVSVANRLDMVLELIGPPVVVTENSALWRVEPVAELRAPGSPEKSSTIELPRRADARRLILIKVTPSYLEALSQAALPYFHQAGEPESAGVHEELTLQIPYRNSAGMERVEELRIPIRFHPWIGQLLMATAIGALAGGLLRWLRIRKGTPRSLPVVLVSSLILAVAGEVLALILVSLNSKLRLVGFELDPYQLLSAGALGFLFGLLGLAYFEARLEDLRKPR